MSTRPTVWTIAAEARFLDALVAGLFERHGRDPLALAAAEIILPSRRAARSLTEAFLRASGGTPLLLPRLSVLGDLDEDEIELGARGEGAQALDLPPAIAPLRRQLLLARLVRRWGRVRDGGEIPPGQALALAGDLARLIDLVHAERVGFDRLESLAPPELARHWEVTVEFLAIVREHWPALLEAEGAIDPADRRNRLIAARIAAWQARPPETPVIAAGFATAIPAAADLLAAIAALPAGAVVLPGLDRAADDALWAAIGADSSHPQHGLARLLDRIGISREAVADWPALPAAPEGRALILREVMLPAAETQRWRQPSPVPSGAFDGLTRLDLAGPQEEAGTIALLLRERLETPGATAMLVTPDRGLARRVAAELRRWEIEIDDSGGVPLARTPPAAFLRLLGEAALERLAPVPLLALLQHPLAAAGLPAVEFREHVRAFERECLRGPRPAPGLAGLRALAGPDELELVDRLNLALGEFLALSEQRDLPFGDLVAAHVRAAERLAATDEAGGAERLWAQDAGEALALFVAELAETGGDFEPVAGADYPVLFEAALAGRVVRPRWGRHARLQILGTLEARLQSADLVVLGGLNEGAWPADPGHDPWMSRPMRKALGLPALEARVGQAAHDFAMAFMAREVVMTRALRVEGTPTVPSRWLLRLNTVLSALQMAGLPESRAAFRDHQRALDRPAEIRAIERPVPRPPAAARPRELWVTEIETWRRDPYAIYARRILRLEPLDPLDQEPGAAERGSLIHQALDAFLRAYPGNLPPDAAAALEAAGRTAFGAALSRPGVWAFWWPRFRRIAAWWVETERERRAKLAGSQAETEGRLAFDGRAAPFRLRARADRIDRLAVGGLAIIDYKTGVLARPAEVMLGFAPQLALEAAIAEAGGFDGVPAAPVAALEFWRLSGGDPAGEIKPLADPAALAEAAHGGLERLIWEFDDPATPYPARPHPAYAPRYGNYDHLSRVLEWGETG
ncbi:MAG TPA: double-strand break repair protein AddB [Stellaceae bacterium]|nr:double-strand break repair protein AddB [Stellaceae bacterium]